MGALHNVIAERSFRVSGEILNGFTKARLLATRDDVEQWVPNASEVVKGVPGHIPTHGFRITPIIGRCFASSGNNLSGR